MTTSNAGKPAVPGTRLKRASLATQVAEAVRAGILDGTFPLGSQLNEAELAARYEVSRGPVREALARIVQEGLAHSLPHRGVFVPDLGEADLSDIRLVRRSVELSAMEQVMASGDRRPLHRQLGAIAADMERARHEEDWPLMASLDMLFHRTLVEAAGSERLTRVYATIQAEIRLCLPRLIDGYRGNAAVAEEHQRLADLMLSGPPADALAELRRHLGDPAASVRKAARAGRQSAA